MWLIALILGSFGVVLSTAGMIKIFIDECTINGFPIEVVIMAFIGIIVIGASSVGIYGIVKIIKRNKELFL
jgi:hypothetical protein